MMQKIGLVSSGPWRQFFRRERPRVCVCVFVSEDAKTKLECSRIREVKGSYV